MNLGTRHLALIHIQQHPAEAARILERCPADSVARVLARAPAETAAALLASLAPVQASACLEKLDSTIQRAVLEACPVPTAAALLRVLPEVARTSILASVPSQARRRIERLLQFPPNTAGSEADPGIRVLHDDTTVEQAIDQLRNSGETIPSVVVVISRQRRVLGTITAAQLLGAPSRLEIGSLDLKKTTPVSQRVPLSALAGDERFQPGPVAVVDSTGALAGVIGGNALRNVGKSKSGRRAADLASELGELYWAGMGRFLGATISVSRTP